MLRKGKTYKRMAKAALVWVFALAWFAPSPAAAASYTVSEETDFYFTIESDDTLVVIYGNSNESCEAVTTDPYLWLYDDNPESTGQLIAQNDDGNHNDNDQCVSSKIYTTLNAGDYRLRAGYCCSQVGLGNTMSWGDGTYEIVTDLVFDGVSPNTPTTTTTTIPQTIGDPTNLTLTVDYYNGTVKANWDAPTDGNVDPERYAIGFGLNDDGNAGPYGVATGNVGDENALVTEYTFNASYIEQLFNEAHGLFNVNVRSDNDTNSLYSSWTPVASTTIMNMPDVVDNQTYERDDATGDLTFSWDASSDGFVDPTHYKIAWNQLGDMWEIDDSNVTYTQNISSTSYTVDYDDLGTATWYFNILACGSENDCHIGKTMEIQVSEGTPPTTTTTVPPTTTTTTTTTLPPTTTTTTTIPVTTTTTLPPTTTTTVAPTTTTEAPPSTTTTTTTTTTVPPTTSTSTTTTTSSTSTTTTTTVAPTTTTTTSTTIPRTPPTTTTVPPTPAEERAAETKVEFEELGIDTEGVDLIEVDEAEIKIVEELDQLDEELAEEFLSVVDGDITVEEIESLISDENFDEISDDAKVVLVAAINEADDEVKNEFENTVDIFDDEAYNEYVAEGSTVDTETRRTVVAAAAAVSVAAAASAGPSGPAGGGGSGGGGGGAGGDSGGGDKKGSSRRRRSR